MRIRKALTPSIAATLLLSLPGLAGTDAGSALERVESRGKLVMLCFPHVESNFARPNLELGPTRRSAGREHFEGFDVEMISAFADFLGVGLEIRTLDTPGYQHLLPALVAGKADLAASSLSITDERRKLVDFSAPYLNLYRVIVARRSAGISSIEDLQQAIGVTIAGSSHEEYLAGLGIDPAQLRHVEFTSEYFSEMEDGGADFALLDSTTAESSLHLYPEVEVVMRLPGEDHYGVAFPPGSDLRPAFDRFLAELESSGRLGGMLHRELAGAP